MLFSRQKESKNILVFDIGSSSVNCFLLFSSKGNLPKLISSVRSHLPLLENPDFKHIERHTKTAIREVSTGLRRDFPKIQPDLIFVVISAPWYFCETKLVKISRREPFTITEDLVKNLIADELELFRRKAKDKFPSGVEDIEILESEAMRFLVNGYRVKNPFGKNTTQLEVAFYASAVKKSFLGSLNEILGHFFGNAPIKISSEPFSLFRALSDIVNPEDGFVVADIGGEITEVYLVRGGVLENVSTFTWGGNLIVRRLASLLKVGLGEALSLFKVSSRGDSKTSINEKFAPAVEGVCLEWKDFLAHSLFELGKNEPLPQTLLLLGGVAGNEVLKNCATSKELASFTILGKPFNLLTFIPENLEGRISIEGLDRKDPQMTLPLILILSASKYAWQG